MLLAMIRLCTFIRFSKKIANLYSRGFCTLFTLALLFLKTSVIVSLLLATHPGINHCIESPQLLCNILPALNYYPGTPGKQR